MKKPIIKKEIKIPCEGIINPEKDILKFKIVEHQGYFEAVPQFRLVKEGHIDSDTRHMAGGSIELVESAAKTYVADNLPLNIEKTERDREYDKY